MAAVGKASIRLDAWECVIMRRALWYFRKREDWKTSTDGMLDSLMDSLDIKLAREYSRRRHSTRTKDGS